MRCNAWIWYVATATEQAGSRPAIPPVCRDTTEATYVDNLFFPDRANLGNGHQKKTENVGNLCLTTLTTTG